MHCCDVVLYRGQTAVEGRGLGIERPAELGRDDDEFDAYRKRMMLAYRFRPNPLVNISSFSRFSKYNIWNNKSFKLNSDSNMSSDYTLQCASIYTLPVQKECSMLAMELSITWYLAMWFVLWYGLTIVLVSPHRIVRNDGPSCSWNIAEDN